MKTYRFKPNKDYMLCRIVEEDFSFTSSGKPVSIYEVVKAGDGLEHLEGKLIIPEPEIPPTGFSLEKDMLYLVHKDWIRIFAEKQ